MRGNSLTVRRGGKSGRTLLIWTSRTVSAHKKKTRREGILCLEGVTTSRLSLRGTFKLADIPKGMNKRADVLPKSGRGKKLGKKKATKGSSKMVSRMPRFKKPGGAQLTLKCIMKQGEGGWSPLLENNRNMEARKGHLKTL